MQWDAYRHSLSAAAAQARGCRWAPGGTRAVKEWMAHNTGNAKEVCVWRYARGKSIKKRGRRMKRDLECGFRTDRSRHMEAKKEWVTCFMIRRAARPANFLQGIHDRPGMTSMPILRPGERSVGTGDRSPSVASSRKTDKNRTPNRLQRIEWPKPSTADLRAAGPEVTAGHVDVLLVACE